MIYGKHFDVNSKVHSFTFDTITIEVVINNSQLYFLANDVARAVTHQYVRVHPYIDKYEAIKVKFHNYARTPLSILWRGKDYSPKFLLTITGTLELVARLAPNKLSNFKSFIFVHIIPDISGHYVYTPNTETYSKFQKYGQNNNASVRYSSNIKLLSKKIFRLSNFIAKKSYRLSKLSYQLSKLLKKYFIKTGNYFY